MGGSSGGDSTNFNPYQGNYGNSSGAFNGYNNVGYTGVNPTGLGGGYISQNGQNTLDPSQMTDSLFLGGGNLPQVEQNSLQSGIGNLQQSSNQFLPLIGGYLNQGQQGVNQATNQALPGLQSIYGNAIETQGGLTGGTLGQQGQLGSQAQSQSQDITNQNLSGLSNLMNNYDQNFISQLGPSGPLGQQLAGEYNNYGITPSSGAFQQGLGNTLGQLGAQNQLQLGSSLVNNGATSQQNLLGSLLGSQLGTSQSGLSSQLGTASQGASQAGGILGGGASINQNLGSQTGTAPLSLLSDTLGQQQSLINEGTQLPINNFQNSLGYTSAQQLGSQNQAAQNQAAQYGLLGQLGGSGVGAYGNVLANNPGALGK